MTPSQRFRIAAEVAAARLARDERGIAAVEFAVILPVMLAMFFAIVELSSGVAVNRKVTIVARTLSDLTSQSVSVTDSDLTGFFTAGNLVLWPYSTTPIRATITELYIDPTSSTAKVMWSKDNGSGTARVKGDTVAIPANLIAKDASNKTMDNQYLIYSEIEYAYVPAVGYVMNKTGVTLSNNAYTRPRQSTCVLLNATTGACPKS
jgi:Flp pilus assembly protein TadG